MSCPYCGGYPGFGGCDPFGYTPFWSQLSGPRGYALMGYAQQAGYVPPGYMWLSEDEKKLIRERRLAANIKQEMEEKEEEVWHPPLEIKRWKPEKE